DDPFDEVVAHGRTDDEEQTGGGGERGCERSCGDERDDPIGKLRDLGIREHDDVAVDVELVLGRRRLVRDEPFPGGAALGAPGGVHLERRCPVNASPARYWMRPSWFLSIHAR